MKKELQIQQMNIKVSNLKKSIYLLFALIISILLIMPQDITWAKDRENYLVYAHSSLVILLRYINEGLFSVFSNEPLFLMINIVLGEIFSPEALIKIIIFCSTLLVLYSMGYLTKFNFLVIILFLLLPQVIKNHIIHLRQGTALAVYLLGFVPLFGKRRMTLRLLACFIHSSVLFLFFFEIMEKILKYFKLSFASRLLIATIFLIGFIQSIPFLAMVMQDRRAQEYSFSMAADASGMGIIIWACIAFLFIMVIDKKELYHVVACYGLIFYISSYFFLDFGARVFENIIPLLIIGILNLKDKYAKFLLVGVLILFGLLNWITSGLSFLI